jgi:hypothetical protein
MRSEPTQPNTSWTSPQLAESEIESLRRGKKLIAEYVKQEFPELLKQRHLEHLLEKSKK